MHTSAESLNRGTPWVAALCITVSACVLAASAPALAADVPLPPPPPGTKRIPLPPPPPGMSLKPSSSGPAERCTACHMQIAQGRIVHPALDKNPCSACHKALTGQAGKCKSRTASKWALTKPEPELCYGCHARKDQSKFVHTAVRQGSCLSCHDAHSSNFAGRLKLPREQVCFKCHEREAMVSKSKAVTHAPVIEGLCGDCHDSHGSNLPFHMKGATSAALCMNCHDAKAPTGKFTPGPGFRIDLSKKFVHPALKRVDCLGCHDGGHSSENLKLLKKSVVDLCYGCHERKDSKLKYPHGAVVLGDCAVCHDPHASDQPKRLTKATINETCFICHQDDLTGRKAIHKPIEKGCDQCHASHGSQFRNGLKDGEGKAVCYKCHKPVDTGKYKHAALERYGCTGCHDSHGGPNRGRVAPSVNASCIACHPQQKDGRHVSPLAAKGHVVDGAHLKDPKREGRDFTCASCHDAHGSNSPKLLYVGKTAMESCAWCHGDKSGRQPALKDVIMRARRPAGPGATGTGGGSPGGGSPGAGSPGNGSPGAGSPGAGSPGAGSPGAGSGSGSGGSDQ